MTDTQTKLKNRHAMNQHIEKLKGCKNFGIIYCDINGLKQVNDSFGHQEGDRLILRACECLRQALANCHLYRIGGDEFLALCPNTTESSIKEKITLLQKLSAEKDVSLSIGMSWTANGTKNIEGLISVAEQQMYKDKSHYYETNSVLRRKH